MPHSWEQRPERRIYSFVSLLPQRQSFIPGSNSTCPSYPRSIVEDVRVPRSFKQLHHYRWTNVLWIRGLLVSLLEKNGVNSLASNCWHNLSLWGDCWFPFPAACIFISELGRTICWILEVSLLDLGWKLACKSLLSCHVCEKLKYS